MAAAHFQIGEQNFSLEHGIYLVCGPKVTNSSELILQLQHESVEDKHALIYVEEDGFSLLDLQTKTGTFLNGTHRLAALKKTNVSELDKICFGSCGDGIFRYATVTHQKSSGFHDTLQISANSTIDTNASIAKATATTKNMNKTDSFNIPETQMIQPNNPLMDSNKCNDNNDDSIPETQELQISNVNNITNNLEKPENDEGSQFFMSTQEFNETFETSLHDNSSDLLKHLEFIIDNSQATAVPVNVPENSKNIQNPLTIDNEASSVEMEALNWSNTNTSKAESALEEKTHAELRSTSVTPDLFEPLEPASFNAENEKSNNLNNNKIAVDNSVDAAISISTIAAKKTNEIGKANATETNTVDDTPINFVKENPPLQLSNKENMELLDSAISDLEPTQRYVPKKDKNLAVPKEQFVMPAVPASLVDSDLEPTQIFVSKKDTKQIDLKQQQHQMPKETIQNLDTDLEPTQVFVPKKALENRTTSTPLQTSKKVTEKIQNELKDSNSKKNIEEGTAEINSNSNLINFFKEMDTSSSNENGEEITPKKTPNKDEEQIFPNPISKETEILFQTPQFIANAFDEHLKSNSKTTNNKQTVRRLYKANEKELEEKEKEYNTDMLEAPFQKHQSNDFDQLIEQIQTNVNSIVNDSEVENAAIDEIDKNAIEKEKNSNVENIEKVSNENNVNKVQSTNANNTDDEEASKLKNNLKEKNIKEFKEPENVGKLQLQQSTKYKKFFTSQVIVKLKDIGKQFSNAEKQKSTNSKGTNRTTTTNRNLLKEDTNEETKNEIKTERLKRQNSNIKPNNHNNESNNFKRSKLEIQAHTTRLRSNLNNNATDKQENYDNNVVSTKNVNENKKSIQNSPWTSSDDEVVVKLKDIKKERLKTEKIAELKKSSSKLTEVNQEESVKRTSKRLKSQNSETKTNQSNQETSTRSTRLRSRNDSEAPTTSTTSPRTSRLRSTDSNKSKTNVIPINITKRTRQNSSSNSVIEVKENSSSSQSSNISMHFKREKSVASEKSAAIRSTRLLSRTSSDVGKSKISASLDNRKEKTTKANSIKRETSTSGAAAAVVASRSSRLRSRTNSEIEVQRNAAKEKDENSKSEQLRKRTGTKIDEIDKKRIKQSEDQTSSKTTKIDDERPTTSKGVSSGGSKKPYKVMFTMVQPEKQTDLIAKSKNLWQIAKNPLDMQILVMDSSNRTVKFLIAMSKGIPIVTTKWVELFNNHGFPSMTSDLMFNDKNFEKEFSFSILNTLNQANMKKIFENLHFTFTEKILPQQNDMKVIIQAAGGIIHKEVPLNIKELYLISSKDDNRLWHSFRRKTSNIIITSTEAAMLAIMRYDIKLLKKFSFN